ncbi:hypothetical protein HYW76_03225 [Candidatus Pacearchaeota archaeon]|nr:hypothetical protein [Candidatus Pacearchaeota archaeon]
MNYEQAAQYLSKIGFEMSSKLAELLNLPPLLVDIPVTIRPLFMPALVMGKNLKFEMFLPSGAWWSEMEKVEFLREREIARLELEACHESGHAIHLVQNTKFRKVFDRARRKNNKSHVYESLYDYAELTAEYLALFYVDLQQGLGYFLQRLPPDYSEDKHSAYEKYRKKYISDKILGVEQKVARALILGDKR